MIYWSTGNVSDLHALCMLIFILVHTCTDTPKRIYKSTANLLDCRLRVPYVRKSYKNKKCLYIVHFLTDVWMSEYALALMFTWMKTKCSLNHHFEKEFSFVTVCTYVTTCNLLTTCTLLTTCAARQYLLEVNHLFWYKSFKCINFLWEKTII